MNRHIRESYSSHQPRSHPTKLMHTDINSFRIKYAETRYELGGAFRLVYDEYKRSGYVTVKKPGNLLLHIHHFIDDTVVLLMLYREEVVSTLSLVLDTKEFGLPMDSIYQEELNILRKNGHRLMEGCALATSESFRGANIFSYLFRQAYWHAVNSCATDICIMVNPKHIQFYKRILLFDDLGVEKNYPRVGAPAIALRIDVNQYPDKLKFAYNNYPAESNLYNFICENKDLAPDARSILFDIERHNGNGIGEKVTRYFINALPLKQRKELSEKLYYLKN